MTSILVQLTQQDLCELADFFKAGAASELVDALIDPVALFNKLVSSAVAGPVGYSELRRQLTPAKAKKEVAAEDAESAPAAFEGCPQWLGVQRRTAELYGEANSEDALLALGEVVKKHLKEKETTPSPAQAHPVGQSDATLITYADSFTDSSGDKVPLQCLSTFLSKYGVCNSLQSLHLLPMYPWDTDRGFSIMDYFKVDPRNGTWEHIHDLMSPAAGSPKLMFDFVCNHASVDNPVVQGALLQRHLPEGHPEHAQVQRYKDFVIAYESGHLPPDECLATLTRPRANPVLTPYFVVQKEGESCKAVLGTPDNDAPEGTADVLGKGFVWTTFSRGKNAAEKEQTRQVDLNFRNPAVLAEVIHILLFYVQHGASSIRLDAIGYIWKVLGSASIHERGTHALLEIVRAVMQIAAPGILTVAEVNEPQSRCLEYLGAKGAPECDMVYQFSAFPLAIHATIGGNTIYFAQWLNTLHPFRGRQFITVLGSHDGLSQKQARELLPPDELEMMQQTLIEDRGGKANYASAAGVKIVYEICGTPWTLVNGSSAAPVHSKEFNVHLARYIAVLCLGLIPRGMPGVYVNGLLGTSNYQPPEGLDENRTLNRETFDISKLFSALDEADSKERTIFRSVQAVLDARAALPQFNRYAPPPVVIKDVVSEVLAVVLHAVPSARQPPMLVLINVSSYAAKAELRGLPAELLGCQLEDALHGAGGHAKSAEPKKHRLYRLKSRNLSEEVSGSANLSWKPDLVIDLAPYEVQWLQRKQDIGDGE